LVNLFVESIVPILTFLGNYGCKIELLQKLFLAIFLILGDDIGMDGVVVSLDLIIENENLILLIIDKSYKITFANLGAEKFYGFSREELGLMNLSELMVIGGDSKSLEEINPFESELLSFKSSHIIKSGAIKNVFLKSSKILESGEIFLSLVISEVVAEDDFKLVIDQSPYAFFQTDKRGDIIYVNKAARDLTGFSTKEILGQNTAALLEEQSLDKAPLRYDLLNKHKRVLSERKIKTKSGNPIPISMFSVKLDNGRYQSFIRDISEEVKMRSDLKDSEEKYRIAFITSPDALSITTLDGVFVDINNGFTALTGFNREDIIGKTSSDLNLWYDLADRDMYVNSLKKNGVIHNLETKFRLKDGKIHESLMSAGIILINKVPHILSTTINIGELVEAKKSLEVEKERLHVTLQSIGDGVITTGIDGRVTFLNFEAEELVGWSQADALGLEISAIFNIYSESSREKIKNPVESALANEKIVEWDNAVVLVAKDSSEILITTSVSPIKNSFDDIIGAVLVFHDITNERRMLDAIKDSQRLDSLGILAGGIAHDFNNLLSGIFGFIDLALAENDLEVIYEYLNEAFLSMDRAKGLTSQLLTFAKGGVPIKRVYDLKQIVDDNVSFALSGSNISVAVDSTDSSFLSLVDKNQIGQVLDNLLINAKQSMKSGGKISIVISHKEMSDNNEELLSSGSYVHIKISDSGLGMSGDVLSHIFEPFFTTKNDGHGLGLATSYSIVQKHNGSISASSILGSGTTFNIYLPATTESLLLDNKIEDRAEDLYGKILILDDDRPIREFLSKKLGVLGFEVDIFERGEDVIDFLANRDLSKYRAMIFDLTIRSGMGGRELVKNIRAKDKTVPIFVMSGYSSDPIMSNPEKYGFSESIEKPFSFSSLKQLLMDFLD